jgi:hypothetical protein
MPELYWGTTGDFVAGATQDHIAEAGVLRPTRAQPLPSELRSWQPADDLSEPT